MKKLLFFILICWFAAPIDVSGQDQSTGTLVLTTGDEYYGILNVKPGVEIKGGSVTIKTSSSNTENNEGSIHKNKSSFKGSFTTFLIKYIIIDSVLYYIKTFYNEEKKTTTSFLARRMAGDGNAGLYQSNNEDGSPEYYIETSSMPGVYAVTNPMFTSEKVTKLQMLFQKCIALYLKIKHKENGYSLTPAMTLDEKLELMKIWIKEYNSCSG